jgi:hypothetical protein
LRLHGYARYCKPKNGRRNFETIEKYLEVFADAVQVNLDHQITGSVSKLSEFVITLFISPGYVCALRQADATAAVDCATSQF